MAVNEKHPNYVLAQQDWILMDDSYKGEKAVKLKKSTYLPYTSGQRADGIEQSSQAGYMAYEAYIKRARYPGFVREAVQTGVGMLHNQPPKVLKLPKKMEGMIKKATVIGEGLVPLLRRINEAQLNKGRIGILLDWPENADPSNDLPYIAISDATSIINWDNGKIGLNTIQILNLVVLNETESVRNGTDFNWTSKEKYRVLMLDNGVYKAGVFSQEDNSLDFDISQMRTPKYRGKPLTDIPFAIINSCDLNPEPDQPPLLDLANLCMTIYRGEADYRQNLFMQGQDTLVIVGNITNQDDDETLRTGAGAVVNVAIGGDAKYIGVESSGLSEQRTALENDRARAGSMGAQSLDTVSRQRESGSSLQTRIAARTADLNQIALTGAAGLMMVLKIAAKAMGLDPDEVVIEPNMDFGDTSLSSQDLTYIASAKNEGFPISGRSMHQLAKDKGYSALTYEEELAELEKEKGGILDKTPPPAVPGNPAAKKVPNGGK